MTDLIGQRFGRLRVIARAKPYKQINGRTRSRYLCQCDCGNVKKIKTDHLTNGDTRSCGCLSVDLIRIRGTKHGHSKRGLRSKTYYTWLDMTKRCTNPKNNAYLNYGGRGIKVCDRWQGEDGFQNFLHDMGERPSGMTLERRENDKNYSPENCEWATRLQQANNKRSNLEIWTGEIYVTMKQFAKACGIPYRRFQYFYRRKAWSVEKIIYHFGGE